MEHPASRVKDVKSLSLPDSIEQSIAAIVDEHKMDWELWIQSADDFEVFRASLGKRGYTNLPNYSTPLYRPERDALTPKPVAIPNTRALHKPKTMLQRKKD
jgi:hypothetical protein